jgi:hypothetical protein
MDFQLRVSVATKVAGIYRETFNGQKSKGTTHLDSRARPHLEKNGSQEEARLANCQDVKTHRRRNQAKGF